MPTFKNPREMANSLKAEPKPNKYNLLPSSSIRPSRAGSMSQEIGSTYNHLSDLYGIDLNDLVYGDKGFMKTKYPQGFPDFAGDVVYSEKYWDEFEDWLNKDKNINLMDRRWERYKLDPDWYERQNDDIMLKPVREYGKKIEPDHPIHKRPYNPDMWW